MTTNNNPRKRSRKAPQAPAVSWVDPKITQGGDPLDSQPPAEPQPEPQPQAPEPTVTVDGLDAPVSADLAIDAALTDDDAFERLAMATARKAMAPKAKESDNGSAGPDNAVWPAATIAKASAAGLRLPGLYPKPGSKSASKSNTFGNGWFRSSGKPGRPPGRNASAALQTLWDMIGSRLAAGETVPVGQLFTTIKAIKATYKAEGGDLSVWADNLLPTEGKGHATCVLHQLAIQAGSIFMNTDTIRKV